MRASADRRQQLERIRGEFRRCPVFGDSLVGGRVGGEGEGEKEQMKVDCEKAAVDEEEAGMWQQPQSP